MPHEIPHADDVAPRRKRRRRIFLAVFVVLFVAALALTPPLLNVDRLRHRIATSMSESLGRPVHLDGVTFHVLPVPGFTLTNLVVSEDPAFGNEPVIRAMDVEAILRVSSLYRRQVEFSTIRFVVDDNGSAPSINLVRNAQGRWNLEDILEQASHANTAPTAQRKAGPAPRFPYIEATGARLNFKLGDEKLPFSLTDADFALWLPSPQQWHIRLKAKPSRTDTNASDTGTVTLEGTLGKAATLADVPLNLTASWARVPTGEATRVVTGADQEWRGTVEMGATLTGTVGNGHLAANLHLNDLRREDFFPARTLDVSAHCTAASDLTRAALTEAVCTIPSGGEQPITVSSKAFDLENPRQSEMSVTMAKAPLGWMLEWARMFSQHIPADLEVQGLVDGAVTYSGTRAAVLPNAAGPNAAVLTPWSGSLEATLTSAEANGQTFDFSAKPYVFDWVATASTARFGVGLELQPVAIPLGPGSQVMLTSTLDSAEYTLHVSGIAEPKQIAALGNAVLTPLGDEVAGAMVEGAVPAAMDVTCVHPYNGAQSCTAARAVVVVSKGRRKR